MSIKQLIDAQKGNLALLVANGINRRGNLANTNSWSDLLIALARKHIDPSTRHIPTGVSLTGFYDLLELADDSTGTSRLLQEEFCAPMRKWIPDTHHKAITKWAIAAGCPILTTNFDRVLSLAANARLFSLPGLRFTDYYPWNTYFGLEQLDRPTTGFGIWHVNGTINYRRSIRLGLTHYMGSVARARAWLHRRDASGLFRGRDANGWSGSSTWLHIIFHRPVGLIGGAQARPLEALVSGHCRIMRAMAAMMARLGMTGSFRDISITNADGHLDVLTPLRGEDGLFLWVEVDQRRGNLALAHHRVQKLIDELSEVINER